MKYIIKREDRPGQMLQGLGIGCNANNYTEQTEWTTCEFYATKFENEEIAQAVIDFIANVMDWELGEQLTIEAIQVKEGRS